MAYSDDPNNPRSVDPNQATDALAEQLASANASPEYLQWLSTHPGTGIDNTHLDNGRVAVNDPMNPYPLLAGFAVAPVTAGLSNLFGAAPAVADLGAVSPTEFGTTSAVPALATGATDALGETVSPLANPFTNTSTPFSNLFSPGTLASSGGKGLMSDLFGAGGVLKSIDPTTAILGALSLFKAPQVQTRESFTQPGSITDPRQSLYSALQGVYRLGQGLSERKPVTLRSSYIQPSPEPITIPGLPFQIGGGLAHDPALAHPELLTSQGTSDVTKYDPFQSVIPQKNNGRSGF